MRSEVRWPVLMVAGGLLLILDCKRDKPLPPAPTCLGVDTMVVTYSGYVASAMRQYCTGCHGGASPSGGLALETYTQVRTSAESGQWYDAMLTGSMPPSSKLDDCTLTRLKKWIDAGYPQ